jgi:dipeptidyl-peptidase-4
MTAMSQLSFPRHSAKTQRFTLGAPRTFTLSPDGQRVLFVRSLAGTDRIGRLYQYDLRSDIEELLVDPLNLLVDGEEKLSPEERARRERTREAAGGITSYSTDQKCENVAFVLSGKLYSFQIAQKKLIEQASKGVVIDPQISPDGQSIAYITPEGELHLSRDGDVQVLCTPEHEDIFYGTAEFVASEEMSRHHGFWWSADSQSLFVERFDQSPVTTIWISDPANPNSPPRDVRYPFVGTPNVITSLFILSLTDFSRREITWNSAHEYLCNVIPGNGKVPPLILTMSRNQRHAEISAIDPDTAKSRVIAELKDSAWIDLVGGVPAWSPSGELITHVIEKNTHSLAVNGAVVTPENLQVDGIIAIDRDGITFSGSFEPAQSHIYWRGWGGEFDVLTSEPGLHMARTAGGTLLLISRTMESYEVKVTIKRDGFARTLLSLNEKPEVDAKPLFLALGQRQLHSALVLPQNREPKNLPLLVDPYGGPGHARVLHAKSLYAEAQWIANQGFAVLISDGRGTPHRTPQWEREILDDLSTAPVEDQADAVIALMKTHPGLIDGSRVAIRGWSFGGYLAGLAAVRRPDIFKAAIIGAPVTDFRLYDTFYTERFMGPDDKHPNYEKSSLLNEAKNLTVPVMIIHGMVDDNVLVANSLKLSSALLEAGKAHEVLPLTGVTHMTPQEVVAENLMLLELDFLKRALQIAR